MQFIIFVLKYKKTLRKKTMNLQEKLTKYQDSSIGELHALLKTLVEIPAPSHHEEKRAEFIKSWLESFGAKIAGRMPPLLPVILITNSEFSRV